MEISEDIFQTHGALEIERQTGRPRSSGVAARMERPTNLDRKIRALVDEGEFFDMRHLLDSSTIEKALIGVSYIQQFHPDENG